MLIGCHIRVGDGFAQAMSYAAEVGCECVQVFAKNPQQWRGPKLDAETASEARELVATLAVAPLYTHTAYLINLGSEDPALWARSVDALADELRRGAGLGAEGVVTHIGTNVSRDLRRGAARVAEAVAAACEAAGHDAGTLLLLENSAGAGSAFGCSFDELGAVCGLLSESRLDVGLCLDTCHAHAYGYDLSSERAWSDVLERLESVCGASRLRLLHANDCLFPRGARRDRHAWIGDGEIGEAGFAAMVSEPRLAPLPVIMEMPGETPLKDVENLRRLKSLRAACAEPGDAAEPAR